MISAIGSDETITDKNRNLNWSSTTDVVNEIKKSNKRQKIIRNMGHKKVALYEKKT